MEQSWRHRSWRHDFTRTKKGELTFCGNISLIVHIDFIQMRSTNHYFLHAILLLPFGR